MFHFNHPEVLWLLVLIPLLAFLKGRRGDAAAIRYSTAQTARALAGARKSRAGKAVAALRMLALGFLVVALARPQIVHGTSQVDASGIDIILGVDVSSSMKALDFTINGKPANRIDVVKRVVSRFIDERPNDRIGLVVFAGRPYMVSPLTLDHDWLQQRLETVKTGMVEDGTAIGSAIASCVNRLRGQKAKSKVVILLTDGMNNAGKVPPLIAAEAAEALGIKVYTIGAGSRGEASVPVTDRFGNRKLARARVDIDEETLNKVARMTNAHYFRATDTDSLGRIYDEINKLEKTSRKITRFENRKEVFLWAALPALLLLAFELILGHTRFRRLP
ncbi:MAG: VWA domain-containing protein [Deltaproteobacteria bacterium]|nr:VWA domain-containing protein [Deltaproteobacteria bacterium]MBW2047704.1 VWA domain-containing protein [Deltaproteobacteria bacterium]MBW2353216.1 VWA domain-containing protein [Deltaproteobacteria bacterium]